MSERVKIYEVPAEGGPEVPSKIIVESGKYHHSFQIVRTRGIICKPWAALEISKIITGEFGGGMTRDDFALLKNHGRWALSKAQEMAKELALREQQGEEQKRLI